MFESPVAVIGGIVVPVLVPLITLAVKYWFDSLGFSYVSSKRRAALSGIWKGTAHQPITIEGVPFDFQVEMELHVGMRRVSGKLIVDYPLGVYDRMEYKLHGGFFHHRFLKLDYWASDTSILAFGSAIFELDAEGRSLSGWAAGYGAGSKRPTGITLELKKV